VLKEFKPDIIIGSKAAEGNKPPDEFDIMRQIENIVMKPSSYYIPENQGILLDMDFKNQSLLAFGKVDEFVEVGYRITMEKMDSIKILVQRRAEDSEALNEKRAAFKASWPPLHFNELEVSGLSPEQEYYVERSMRKSDSIIDAKEMKREYLKLAHDKSLLYLYPKAAYKEQDSLFTLQLRVIPQSPLEARFGLFFSTTGLAQTYLGFSYREITEVSTHLKGNVQFGRLYDGVNLGFRFDYPSRIPLYFQGNFNYNSIDYNSYNANFFFEDLKPSFITEDEINFRLDVGVPYSINGVFKGGLGIGRNKEVYYMTKEFSTTDTSEISYVNKLSLYVAMERNTLNNKQFATEGVYRLHAVRAGYGSEAYFPGSTSSVEQNRKLDYFWFSAKYENRAYVHLGKAFSLGYYMNLHASFKPLLINYFSTLIEAPVFQPNIITKSLFMEHYRANQFVAFGLMPVYNFSKQFFAKAEAYAFFPAQEILRDVNNEAYLSPYFNTAKTLFNASLNFVSVAGPVSFHVGYITEEEKPWVLQLSFGYLLFNKRSIDE
jgi:NTE family protein